MTDQSYFFDKGIRFKCRQCGHCCTGDPGTIYVSSPEVRAIASHLKMSEKKFIRKHLYPFRRSYSIREKPDGDCIFYGRNGCRVYPVRPKQCRTWPFWTGNLRNEERWQRAKQECPGLGRGRLYSKEEILDMLGRMASGE